MDWTGAIIFVVVAYGLSWGWLFAVPHLNIPMWTIAFSSFGPAMAAALVRGPLRREGFRQSGLGFGTPRGRAWTYLFALAVPPVLTISAAAIEVIRGDAQFVLGQSHDPLEGQDYFWNLASGHGPAGLFLVFVTSPLLSFQAFGEEYGWRGYLFPKLMPLGVPVAVVTSGLVWGLWHIPGYFIYTNHGILTFALFVGTTTLGGGLLCWLRLRARSVWPAAIWHEAYDNQGPALAGLLIPTATSVVWLTYALPAFVGIFEILTFGYLFISGRFLRAANEDHVVWTSLLRRERDSEDLTGPAQRPGV
jgi:membrane protease YdiL (CAAX protease family)